MRLVISLILMAASALCQAPGERQHPTQWIGAGLFFNQDNSPQVNGMLAYARHVTNLGEHPGYSFTRVNIWSITRNDPNGSYWTINYRVATSVETGWAQHAFGFRGWEIYGTATAGPMFSGSPDGTTVGTALGTGGFAFHSLAHGITIGPALSIIKPLVSEAANPDAGKLGWAVGIVLGLGDNK